MIVVRLGGKEYELSDAAATLLRDIVHEPLYSEKEIRFVVRHYRFLLCPPWTDRKGEAIRKVILVRRLQLFVNAMTPLFDGALVALNADGIPAPGTMGALEQMAKRFGPMPMGPELTAILEKPFGSLQVLLRETLS